MLATLLKASRPFIVTGPSLYMWGDNSSRAIGDGTNTDRSSPVQIGATDAWDVVSVGGESEFTLAIKSTGTLWAWGNNGDGQLGLGNTTSRSVPVQVGALSDWAQVSAGGNNHTLAVKTDGTLWAWGDNSILGKLGDGTTTKRSSPVQIGALSDWAQVSAGHPSSFAIKTNGTLWAWGGNANGQLGTNNQTAYSSPVQVGALSDWAQVSSGGLSTEAFTLAVKTNGTLWAWGDNSFGQLGLGSTTSYSSPVQVGALSNWAQVSAGALHTSAIKTNGTLWGWGYNALGSVGNGTSTNYSSPVQIGSLSDWAQVAAGYLHSVAVKTNGTLWAWGNNDQGELGTNNTTIYSSPVQVGALSNWATVSTKSGSQTTGALTT